MDRRRFLLTSLAGVLAAPLAAEAQQAGKVYRVGYLSAASQEAYEHLSQAFLRGLKERGWIAFYVDKILKGARCSVRSWHFLRRSSRGLLG